MNQLTQTLAAQLSAALATSRRRLRGLRHDERGSVTIQEVLWAVAALSFVAVVVAAINTFLHNQISLLH